MITPLPLSETQVIPGGAPNSTSVPQPIVIQNQPPQGQYFTADQLEAARQQEKDKLYAKQQNLEKQVNDFRTELETLRTEREAAKLAEDEARKVAEAVQKKADEDKLSVTELLEKRDQEWQARQAEIEQKLEFERAVMQKDREIFSLQNFIQRRVAEEVAQDTIAPEFLDYINGNNEEQVEASITRAKEKTASIVAGMSGGIPNPPRITPGVSPTGFAPAGPLDTLQGTQEYSADDIKKMSHEEFRAFRAKVGIDRAGNNQGLFN